MKSRIYKLVVTLVASGTVFAVGATAFAKGGHHGFGPGKFEKLAQMDEQERLEFLEGKLEKRVARMQQKLDLTPEQTAKVRQILADSQTQMLEIWEKNKDVEDKTAAKADARAVFEATRKQIDQVLTAEQKAKQAEHRAKKAQHFKGKMLERLDEKLDLTADQRTKIEKILDDKHAKMKELHESGTVDHDAKKAIFEATSIEIEKVLTAEQKVEYAKMRERMKEKGRRHGKHRGDF